MTDVTFVVFSIAVIAWSLSVLRWSFSIRHGRGRTMMRLLSWTVIAAGALSIAGDVRDIGMAWSAAPSDLVVRIMRRGAWWQLDYARQGVAFRTANELHVPAGVRLTMEWSGVPPPVFENVLCLPQTEAGCILVVAAPSARDLRFISAWPPAAHRLPMIVQSRDEFDHWFSNQSQPARTNLASQASLFRNSGCAYCHVIRGIVNEAWHPAPDLTHFASRATIAATGLPNRGGMLTGWVAHPRGLKKESEMPDNALKADDLRAVVAFLESLR